METISTSYNNRQPRKEWACKGYITSNFKFFKKSQNKLDCLIFEMLFIRELKPKLNQQSDSIRGKLSI